MDELIVGQVQRSDARIYRITMIVAHQDAVNDPHHDPSMMFELDLMATMLSFEAEELTLIEPVCSDRATEQLGLNDG